jgi:predicted PurR-regulated permease PerM
MGIRNPYFIFIIVAIITFIFSLFVDFLMRKPSDYAFAVIIGIIFGIIVFILSRLLNVAIERIRK